MIDPSGGFILDLSKIMKENNCQDK